MGQHSPVSLRSCAGWLVVASSVSMACGPQPLPATGTLSTERFVSEVVGDEYVLRIRVPPDYDPAGTTTYPLVLQLDPTFAGLEQYDITVGFVSDRAASGEGPEAIVVGIDEDPPVQRDRDYLPQPNPRPDFSGAGADRFYTMIERELVPHLESQHAIDPTRRYLVGHSNGGVFAWYAALRYDPDDPLLAGVIAVDNAFPEALFTHERWLSERADDVSMSIYATRAAYSNGFQRSTYEAMVERVEARGYPSLKLRTRTLETDHGGAIWDSFRDGLVFLLEDR